MADREKVIGAKEAAAKEIEERRGEAVGWATVFPMKEREKKDGHREGADRG